MRSPLRWKIRAAPVFVLVLHVLLTARLVLFVQHHSVNIFLSDDWNYLGPLLDGKPLWKIYLQQYGAQREGIGLVLEKFLMQWSRYDMRVMAVAGVIALSVAALVILWLKVRLFGSLAWSDAIIPFLYLGLGHYEIHIASHNPSAQIMPLLLTALYALSWTVERQGLRLALVVLLNFLLIYSGYGFFIGLLTPLLLLLAWHAFRARKNREVVTLVAALGMTLASLAGFFADFQFGSAVSSGSCFVFPYHPLYGYPWYAALLLVNMFGVKGEGLVATTLGGLLLALAVALLVIAVIRLAQKKSTAHNIVLFAFSGYSLLLIASTAGGRICLGLEFAQSSRYLPYAFPLFVAFYFYLLEHRETRRGKLLLIGYFAAAAWSCFFLSSRERGTVW